MNVKELQEQIDNTEYWDMKILDVQFKYFGDEIYIYIEDDELTSWKISFLTCSKMKYETDANWIAQKKIGGNKFIDVSFRGELRVRDMKWSHLGYFGQDITISQNEEHEGFINVKMDLTLMLLELSCKEIIVEKVCNTDLSFFWKQE